MTSDIRYAKLTIQLFKLLNLQNFTDIVKFMKIINQLSATFNNETELNVATSNDVIMFNIWIFVHLAVQKTANWLQYKR